MKPNVNVRRYIVAVRGHGHSVMGQGLKWHRNFRPVIVVTATA